MGRLLHRVLRFQFAEPLTNRSIHLRGFRQLLSRDAALFRGIRLNERSIYGQLVAAHEAYF